MKRTLLLCLSLSIVVLALAQNRAIVPQDKRDIMMTRVHQTPIHDLGQFTKPGNPTVSTPKYLQSETEIGITEYDLMSNTALANRIVLHDDGTLSAVWTMGFDDPNFTDRGTGYNYYDGTAWGAQPTVRIETVKTGWPSIAPWGANGEINIAHNGVADPTGALIICKRTQKGTGTWEESQLQGPDPDWHELLWPRVTTTGADHSIIHVIAPTAPTGNGGVVYQGQDPAVLYSRSMDGGVTWDPKNELLPGTGSDLYLSLSADEYTWAEPRGNTIAWVCSDSWHDWFIMKSTDNGDTWTKIMVWENPYPLFDWNITLTTDTMWAPDGGHGCAIDNNGMVHTVTGLTRVAHTEVGTSYNYWPWTDGVAYWNETMQPFEDPNGNQHDALDAWDVLIEDVNLIGWSQDVNNNGTLDFEDEIMSYRELGMTTMANISIRESDNQIFVIYTPTTQTYTNGTLNFKHIWGRKSSDGGITWGDHLDMCSAIIHIFDECFYPTMAGNVDDATHFYYMADATPGTALASDHPYQTNRMVYVKKPLGEWTGVKENNSLITTESVMQNFPNPVRTTTTIYVDLSQQANLSLEVYNLIGQVVYTQDLGQVNAGRQNFVLDASKWDTGMYFYTVTADQSSVTRKMMVE